MSSPNVLFKGDSAFTISLDSEQINPGSYTLNSYNDTSSPMTNFFGALIQGAGIFRPQILLGSGSGSDAMKMYIRRYKTGSSSFTNWVEVLHTNNFTIHLDGTYVKTIGDTMTGNLYIKRAGAATLFGQNTNTNREFYIETTSDNYTVIYNRIIGDGNNRTGIWLAPETVTDLNNLFRVVRKVSGTETVYNVLHSGNYTNFTVTKTGSGASGTWPISISANAATASAIKIHTQVSITTAGAGWYKIASYANTAIPRGQVHFTLQCTGSSVYPHTTEITIDTSWGTSAANYIIIEGHKHSFGGVRVANDGTNTFIEIYTPSALPNTCLLIVPYGTYNYWTNTQWTWAAAGALTASTATTTILEATHNHSGQSRTNNITASAIYGAVWNDYAEYRKLKDSQDIPYGRVVIENGDDSLSLSTHRLQKGGNIVSDTFGFAIGETDESKLPVAVSGRVLAYPNENRYAYGPGDAVCTGPNGTVSVMTEEEIRNYPDRIVGYVSAIPDYEIWGTGNVKVDGRIWIKVH